MQNRRLKQFYVTPNYFSKLLPVTILTIAMRDYKLNYVIGKAHKRLPKPDHPH